MAGVEEAAQAFQEEISPGTRPPRQSQVSKPEPLFQPRQFEDDESGSEDVDHGDRDFGDEGSEEEPRARKPKTKKELREEDDSDEGDESDPEYAELDNEEPGEDEKDERESGGEEDEAEDQPVNLNAKVKVTVEGEQKEIPLKEALNGYIRMETFHQRLSKINEYKQTLDREANEIQQAREIYIAKLGELTQSLDSFSPQEPDWVAEYEKDPKAAAAAQRQWQEFKKQRQALDQERQRVEQERNAEQQKRLQVWIAEQRQNTLVLIPEWNDQRKFNLDKKRMQTTLKNAGFSDQEIAQAIDARYLVIARKAALYDALRSVKIKGKGPANQLRRAGSGNSRTGPTRTSRSAERLARTGSVHDAAQGFLAELNAEERGVRRR